MTATATPTRLAARVRARSVPWARPAPVLVAGLLAAAYVIVSPPSRDLAAHLFRAHLFALQGFGVWNDLWYGGHHILGYSVLFPPVSALLTPQVAAALAATGTAAVFEPLARRHFGQRAWLGAALFGAATAINLYTGRLPLAFGALPALGALVALDYGALPVACICAFVAALCSPVAALFSALAAAGVAVGAALTHRRSRAAMPGAAVAVRDAMPGAALAARAAVPGTAVAVAALAPVALLAVAFPEGGTEPFGLGTLLPVLAICVFGLITVPSRAAGLRAGIAIYALATIAVYLVPSPIGSNIARLGTLLAAPLAALLWWRRRTWLLALALVPLLYVGWQAPVRDVSAVAVDPSTTAVYYQPLLRFLRAQPGGDQRRFRIEIPFTSAHWEADRVATQFPLARGWERQLDIGDNHLFYARGLTANAYERWLHDRAVRFVALPDVALDASAQREAALIRRGLPYLRLVMSSTHWRVYAVADPTPIVQGVATLSAMGSDWLALKAHRPGVVTLHVRFTPYWALGTGAGCVAPAGAGTRLTLRRAGAVRLVIRFSLARVGARSPRCT